MHATAQPSSTHETNGRLATTAAEEGAPTCRRERRRSRRRRRELEQAALELITRHGAELLACARRYAQTSEDAEDAYQRGLEILLTKAPTTRVDDLLPWLKTVVKHEAFALRRQRERHSPLSEDGSPPEPSLAGRASDAGDHVARYETLRLGAEALGRLKPQEVRALLLRAEGYSYREICRLTGWTYTKVNRCLTEGRKAFYRRIDGILEGEECERLADSLSRFADGELRDPELTALRLHLRGCLHCRRVLREYRSAPQTLAALLPIGAAGAGLEPGRSGLETLLAGVQDRLAAWLDRAQATADLVAAKKAAAIAVSAVAIASGGAGISRLATPVRTDPRAPKPEAWLEVGERSNVHPRPATGTAPRDDASPSGTESTEQATKSGPEPRSTRGLQGPGAQAGLEFGVEAAAGSPSAGAPPTNDTARPQSSSPLSNAAPARTDAAQTNVGSPTPSSTQGTPSTGPAAATVEERSWAGEFEP